MGETKYGKKKAVAILSRGKIALCYFAIWRQNTGSPNSYFAASAKIALIIIIIIAIYIPLEITPTSVNASD